MELSPGPPRPRSPASAYAPAPSVDPPSHPVSAPIDADHLARFEFSSLGTKVLMVEWHPTAVPKADIDLVTPSEPLTSGTNLKPDSVSWEVSWPGKSVFLTARETDDDVTSHRRRVYFLLPPETSIPKEVTITPPGRSGIIVKPLPAIFPPGFHADSGSRGVLHTLWAKKRLSELAREMDAELRANAESVGLEMAMAEKQWIMDNFLKSLSPLHASPLSLSPRSPGSGRLGEKLKGLRLATSPENLSLSPTANTFTGTDIPSQTLSPPGDDVAVSSFSSISSLGSSNPGHSEPLSLNAVVRKGPIASHTNSHDGEDDLFALPLSARTPEMKRSPFSVW